jgi:hypothetical protein
MPPSRNRAPSGSQSSFLVLAACAALLGGGWVWVNGGLGSSERGLSAEAPADSETPASAVGTEAESGLFGGLGAIDGDQAAQAAGTAAQDLAKTAQEAGASVNPNPAGITPQWLAGTWVEASVGCATDYFAHFAPGGAVTYFGQSGSWKLQDGTLTLVTRDESEGSDPNAPWTTSHALLAMLGPDRMQLGSSMLIRCP